jgi:hypothetical protein
MFKETPVMSIRLENGAMAQIELDLPDIPPEIRKEIDERAREAIKHQYRDPNSITPRRLLANASADDMQDILEKDMLLEYQETLRQLRQKDQESHDLCELLHNIHASNDNNFRAKKRELEETISRLVSQRDELDRNLIVLQKSPILQKVIERETAKAIEEREQRRKQRREEEIARLKEKAEQTERELRER